MEDAHYEMHQFYPLVYTYCSASLVPLICSIYVPKFNPETRRGFQPCADVCEQVSQSCRYAASKLNLTMLTLLNKCSVGTNSAKCFRK